MTTSGSSDEEDAASLRAQAAATRDLVLAAAPTEPRALELWAQHGAGTILFERVRAAGLAAIDASLPEAQRKHAAQAVDATMYALMMLIDGVSGGVANEEREIALKFVVEVREGERVTYALDLSEGDGMCMGFHGWREGDFGRTPVLAPARDGDGHA